MQEGNILLYSQNLTEQQALVKPQLILIDFEYCSYNYRGFDLANHFVEWIYDYTNPEHPYFSASYQNYPSNEQQVGRGAKGRFGISYYIKNEEVQFYFSLCIIMNKYMLVIESILYNLFNVQFSSLI